MSTTGNNSFVILHISDLHFRDGDRPPAVLGPLREDLNTHGKKVDFVVVSGDLTDRGDSNGYKEAEHFLRSLHDVTAVPLCQFLFCPGNHDVEDSCDGIFEERPRSSKLSDNEEIAEALANEMQIVRDLTKYPRRFDGYQKFVQSFSPQQLGVDLSWNRLFSTQAVQFVSFNSACRIDKHRRDQAGLDGACFSERLKSADDEIRAFDGKLLRIAIWHHAVLGRWSMQDAESFAKRLAKNRFGLVLHGDVHEPRGHVLDPFERDMITLGAGTLHASLKDRPPATGFHYNLLEIKEDLSQIRVRVREQKRDDGPFEGLQSFGRGRIKKDHFDFKPCLWVPRESSPAPNRPTTVFKCASIEWNVSIDLEGNATNEITIRQLESEQDEIKLMSWSSQSGNSTAPLLTRCSSSSVKLKYFQTDSELSVFVAKSGVTSPIDLTILNVDTNVYSMNMRQFKLKASFRQDGVDYLEKWIDHACDRLIVTVRFPEKMTFISDPWFSVVAYDAMDLTEREDAQLTRYYVGKRAYEFRRSLKLGILDARKPKQNRAYRIAWRVPEADDRDGTVFTDEAVDALRRFGDAFFAKFPVVTLDDLRRDALEPFREFLFKTIRYELRLSTVPEIADLDLNIMVLDLSKRPYVLRSIANCRDDLPEEPAKGLEIGDGVAGRAYKTKSAIVFDPSSGENQAGTYLPFQGWPPHAFLISIPMMLGEPHLPTYGVLNIGTFCERDGRLLACLASRERMDDLVEAAGVVLKELMEKAKIGKEFSNGY